MPIGDDTYYWRRDLPHLENAGRTYYITFVSQHREELPESARTVVLQTITRRHRRDYFLHGTVVMPDHVHMVSTPFERTRLTAMMQQIKSVSSHDIRLVFGGSGPIWQREYFDRILRSDEDIRKKVEYIVANPVRAGLVVRPDDYPWIWRWWLEGGRRAGEGAGAPLGTPALD
jgi:putative transposase